VSKSNSENNTKFSRRQALLLSATAGAAALAGKACSPDGSTNMSAPRAPAAGCSTPRTAVANTEYGEVRGYVENGVLTFKGVPYGANTGGENRWLPANPPHTVGGGVSRPDLWTQLPATPA
jgi:para-nitrobenzyl esterase